MRPATERQKKILRRAARTKDGRLKPHSEDMRLWMNHLTQMSKKGYIRRDYNVAYITDIGRMALWSEPLDPVEGCRTGPALFRNDADKAGFAKVAG
jgi:hypothetical protein